MNNGNLYIDKLIKEIEFDEVPLKKYPRPNLVRKSYLCLNGKRDLEITKTDDIPSSFSRTVNVPYALETPLSGINYLVEPDDRIYYRRRFKFEKTMQNSRIIINFDGVDMFCDVYVNGKLVGKHSGGYTKFSFDITDFLTEEITEIIVKVIDITDTSYHLRGKQVLETTGVFYTSSSGIYKTVWLEEVPEKRILGVRFTPLFDDNSVSVKVLATEKGEALLKMAGNSYIVRTNIENIIKLDNPRAWSYKDPFLYYVDIAYEYDKVSSYFGFRKIEIKKDEKGLPGIYLNNKRIILNGLLDQGYYFLGNLTPKSYKDYENEILNLKELGYNTLRKHIKVESDLYYYYCDLYGILLIQDFVNGGTSYKFSHVCAPRMFTPFLNKESRIKEGMFGRADIEGQKEFVEQSKEIVDSLYNHPSIIIYTIFNEAWGEFKPSEMYDIFKKYDPTRLYDTASGWVDSKNSDFYSVHTYTFPAIRRIDKKYGRPYLLSEIGGISWKIKGHSYFDGFFGHGAAFSKKGFNKKYFRLYKHFIKQLKDGTLNGLIYTEVADCETEYNGIYTFDREILKLEKEQIISLNKEIEEIYK